MSGDVNPMIVVLASAQLLSGGALLAATRREVRIKPHWWAVFIALQLVAAAAIIVVDVTS